MLRLWFGSEKRKADRQRCPHGIKGGLALERCPTCVQEQHRKKLLLEAAAKQNDIRIAAAKLREVEATRLKPLITLTLAELQDLSSSRFEDEMAGMFERLGYVVQQTPYTNDQGRDAILKKDGEKFLLECKCYGDETTVGRPYIQKFHSAIITDRAKSGFFVTTSKFTTGATHYAAKVGITLIDGAELLRYLAKSKAEGEQFPESEQYSSMCTACGERVVHELRSPQPVACANGHTVEPTLTLKYVIGKRPIRTIDQNDPQKTYNVRPYGRPAHIDENGNFVVATGWIGQGRQVRKGERAVKGLFHISQTDPIEAPETPTPKKPS